MSEADVSVPSYLERVKTDAQHAWESAGRYYSVTVTEIVEKTARATVTDGGGVMVSRGSSLEATLEAVGRTGWVLHTCTTMSAQATVLGNSVAFPQHHLLFTRP